MEKRSAWKNRILKLLFCCLIMAAMLVCLSGCRDRITNRDDADKEVADSTGTMATAYEERREELDLKEVAEPLMKKEKKEKQKEQEQEQKQKQEQHNEKNKAANNENKGNADNNNNNGTKNKKSGKNNNGSGGGPENGGSNSNNSNNNNGNDPNNTNNENDPGNNDPGGGNNTQTDQNNEQQKKVTVYFDANGGSCVPANDDKREYIVGKEYASMPTAEKKDYIFAGWFTGKKRGSAIYSNTIVEDGERTLYAHWTKGNIYTVTFDPAGGRINSRDKKREIEKGKSYGTLPEPERDGYDFLGWYTESEGGTRVTESSVFKGDSDQTIFAHWKYDPYKYWDDTRKRVLGTMYSCQILDCYIEFDDNETTSSCSLLADSNIGNCARNRGNNTTVTDEWVKGKNPEALIKCKESTSQAASLKRKMRERFQDFRIIVIPAAAVNGNKNEKLYYTLCLGKAIYPSWYKDVDLDKAGEELGVSGSAYE